jgi:hypothetical protein
MKSRLVPLLWILAALVCLFGVGLDIKERVARYNFWVSQDKADSKYLNEPVATLKDGKVITRKVLIDMLILKAAREAQPQVDPNGR